MNAPYIPSPCTGLCKMDPSGFCLGCARTGDEISAWREEADDWRSRTWRAIQPRFETLGVACRRLPWTAEAIRDFVVDRMTGRAAVVLGVSGAAGEFRPMSGEAVTVGVTGDVVTAATSGARLRLRMGDDVRILAFEASDPPCECPVVIAVLRERGRPPLASGITDLGPDSDAIDPADRGGRLYDLGLGRKAARFCVRVGPGIAREALAAHLGAAFPESRSRVWPAILADNPTRVIETSLGRLEVSAPILPSDGRPPDGPHAHLIPDVPAAGRDLPPGFDIPRAYRVGAMICPLR